LSLKSFVTPTRSSGHTRILLDASGSLVPGAGASAPIPRPLLLLLSATQGFLELLWIFPQYEPFSRQAAPILFFFDQLIGMPQFFPESRRNFT
jgi:hypothetical protein